VRAGEIRQLLECDRVLDEWDDSRTYLGMSRIGECPRRLYEDFVDGRERPGIAGLRYCHEGYLHEADIVGRLEKAGIPVANRGRELVAPFDPRFRGHIDGEIGGDLLEIKSVTPEKLNEVRLNGPLPAHRDQAQIYMRYGRYGQAWIVYKARADGSVWVCSIRRDDRRGAELEDKARAILAAVDAGQPPACECGRCEAGGRRG